MQTAQLNMGIRFGIFLALWLGFHLTYSQGDQEPLPGEQRPVPKEVRTKLDGSLYVRYGYQEYLPVGYDSTQTDQKWPLIIHMVGVGERGNGTIQDLDTIAGIGISRLVEKGKDYPFLIMSPQPTGNPKVHPTGPSGKFVPDTLGVFIDYILENYNVDPNRVYITAFSAAAIEAARYIVTNTAKVAAFIPIAGNVQSFFFKNKETFCNLADIPVWAFHNQFDSRIVLDGSKKFIKELRTCTPAPIARPKLTVYPGSTHDAWTKTYNGSGMGIELIDKDYDAFDISIFDWFLKYSKDKAVIADAGSDQYITLPTDSVVLGGIGRPVTDVTYQWAQIGSTPSVATLSGQNTDTITASNLVTGTYEFEFIITDAQNNVDRDTARVIVKSFVADAGNNITITLPIDSVQLIGQVRTNELGPDQTFTYKWRQVDGPDSLLENGQTIDKMATIKDSTVATTSASGFNAGVYRFEFEVTDNSGGVARDYVQVTVKGKLVANAGNDTTVVLPVEEVILRGSGSDTGGNEITSFTWAQVSGDESIVLQNTDSSVLEISNLKRGVYEFELTVANNNGTASDTVVLTVRNALEANAGNDTTVTLPVEQLEIMGSASDATYEIVSYTWEKISGPEVTISGEDQATLILSNLQKGTYAFEFTVTNDNNEEAKDTVAVQVVTTNDSLVANAGEDINVNLPQESVEITGSGTDPYNTITSYLWTKLSGPEVTLAGQDQAALTVSSLQEGTYEFELTVTNDNEGVAKDTMVLSVTTCEPPTIAPIEDITASVDQMPVEVPLNISDADLSLASISAISDNQAIISDENIDVVVENGAAKLRITANSDTSGSANITVTVEENCASSEQFKITVNEAVTGVKDELDDLAVVYPNPSPDVFLLRWKEVIPKGAEINIFTTEGALIKRFNVKEAQREFIIDLNTSVKGTYLLLIRVNNKTRTYRIIKQ